MKQALLGELSVEEFLRDYWQKKPLLIRQAIPSFSGFVDREKLIRLSALEDGESRLVTFAGGQWDIERGPFRPKKFEKLPGHWSLLVQGVNNALIEGDALLRQFNFIPYTRLDDLMISFAPDGGGVGPHFDSYDVFLLQGLGKKKWQISAQTDTSLIADAPLKILQHFVPEEEWILEPGDMLYLPPHYAHNGISIGDAMTYSIGFRAASHQEIATEFLVYLQDHLHIDGMYQDPDLTFCEHPAEISHLMLQKVREVLQKIQWDDKVVEKFVGMHLSEPKPNVYFNPPKKPLNSEKFSEAVKTKGLRLDLKTLLLFSDNSLYINGEAVSWGGADKALLQQLGDSRELPPLPVDAASAELLYEWYLDGYLGIAK